MNYPKLLQHGDTIGVCAPSSGAPGEELSQRMNNAVNNVKALGYNVIETPSVRCSAKLVSADAETRAAIYEPVRKPRCGGDNSAVGR